MSDRRAKGPEAEQEATTEDEAPAEEMAQIAPADSYEPIVREPVEEGPEPEPQEEPVADGSTRVVYRAPTSGGALTFGDYKFRSDEPVDVPSEVAEELLTMPFELFERL
jgi:hypothetical protein